MKYALCIAIGVLIGYILREYQGFDCPEVKESIDSVRKQLPPVIKETEKPKPVKSYPIENNETSEFEHFPDVGKMVNSCDSIRVYSDTLNNESGTVISQDSIRGELLKKKVTFIPNFLTVTETNVVEKPVPQSGLFIGAEIGFNPVGRNFRLAPEIEYLTKKGNAYSYNYDLVNGVHSVGVKKKLKF